jgi:hypothetical protein
MGLSEAKANQLVELLEELVLLQPNSYTLPQLADMCGVTREAIRQHLMSNFRFGIDFSQKSENATINIKRDVCIKIRRYYGK